MRKQFWSKTVLLGLVCYLLVVAVAWGVVDSLLYHPEFGGHRAPQGLFRIPVGAGNEVTAVYLPNPASTLTIWYFHGNAEDLGDIEPRLRELHDRGFAVFACDFPGYGLSSGRPSEKAIYAANEAAKLHLRDVRHVALERVVLYGRSLGGGPAVDLASREPVAGLVLESAFTSAFRVMIRWPLLPGDEFRNAGKMPLVRCPILIIHGREDRVIPFHHGETLLAAAPGKKSHLWVDRAGHNDLQERAGGSYWTTMLEFTRGLRIMHSGT